MQLGVGEREDDLVTIGVAITWVLGSLAAWALLGIDKGTAAVLGAILVVSGPTVIIPILQHVRPREPSAAILRWEAIAIDPIGALLAIVVLDAVIGDQGPGEAVRRVASTIGVVRPSAHSERCCSCSCSGTTGFPTTSTTR